MAAKVRCFGILRNYSCFPSVLPRCAPCETGRNQRVLQARLLSTKFSQRGKSTQENDSKRRVMNLSKKPTKETRKKRPQAEFSGQRKTVETYLEEWGVGLKKVKNQLDVTKVTVEKCKTVLYILHDLGLERNEVGKVVNRRPGVLLMKEELLKTRLEAMTKSGIQSDALVHVVKHSPGVLTAKTEQGLSQKIKFFQDLNVKPKLTTGEILHILTKCPDLIATCSLSSLEEKLSLLENELKFNRHQVRNILLKQPSTLTFSVNSIQEKYRYCFDKMNVSPSSIARCPRVFQCSLKRLKERHLFLKELGRIVDEMIIDDFGLGVIVTPSDKNFAEKVAKSSLEELGNFRETLAL